MKMSTCHTVFCECGYFEESNLYYNKMNKNQFETQLKSEGWTSVGNRNHCPKCNGVKEEE